MAAPLLGNAGRDLTNVLLFFLARRPTTGLRTSGTTPRALIHIQDFFCSVHY